MDATKSVDAIRESKRLAQRVTKLLNEYLKTTSSPRRYENAVLMTRLGQLWALIAIEERLRIMDGGASAAPVSLIPQPPP